jgi:hypothetical protein
MLENILIHDQMNLGIMKLVDLKKFQSEMIDKGEMLNVIGGRGKTLSIVGGSETGAGEVCASEFSGSTNGTCVRTEDTGLLKCNR